jgi:mannose-6-phosphate isomerase-like protein (cupin superfamily)
MESQPVRIHTDTGARVLSAFGEEVHLYLTGRETGGRFTQWLEITPPGGGPPPHYHTGEDEWFHVLEGRVSFLRDDAWEEVGPGACVWAPRNSVHTFRNTGDTPSRMLLTTAPSGFEEFFARCAAEFSAEGGPDMARVTAIAAEHGIHFLVP